MSRVVRNVINGEVVDAADGRTTDLIDPTTGEVFGTAALSGSADVDRAYAAASKAFETWRDTTPAERHVAMLKIADLIEARADEFVQAEVQNTGKPIGLTESEEIPPMLDQIRFFAGAARILEGRAAGEYMSGHTSFIRREPIGVIGQVTPWNYPMMMAVWKWAPAIAAGNTIVMKPSDTTPVTTSLMAEIINEVLPPGVFNVVCGDRETGKLVVEHPRADMVAITGSTRAGAQVAASAAPDIKRVHLELGGNAPVIVFDDADAEAAAEAIAVAGFFNAGQDCTAATRVIATPGIYPALVAALTEQAKNTVTGPPSNEDALYGPLNNANQLAHVSSFFENVPAHAVVNTGGARVGESGYFFAPTIVSDLKQDDEMVKREIFGPVITVQQAADEAEALKFANDTEYGLSSSVWTADFGRAMRMSRSLDFGCVWINTHIPFLSEMPHGGFKHSGYGKDLSMYGFEDYTRIKHVMANIEP